jgi:acyl carrier protein
MIETESQIKQALKNYIAQNFLFIDEDPPFADDDSLIEQGVIDSTGVLEMVLFIEETFGIEIPDSDVLPENFDSISRLSAYVLSHIKARGSEIGATATI